MKRRAVPLRQLICLCWSIAAMVSYNVIIGDTITKLAVRICGRKLSSLYSLQCILTFAVVDFKFLWPPYVIGQTIILLPCGFFLLLSSSSFLFLALSQRPQIGCLPYFYTWRGPSANLEYRSEMCCLELSANTGRKKVAKNRHLGTIAQLRLAISSQLRHLSTIGKKTC